MAIDRLAPPVDSAEHELALADARVADAERALAQARLEREKALINYVVSQARSEIAPSTRMLTVREVAMRLGIDETTAWRKTSSGVIPSRKLGRSRRISEADLNRWIESQG